MQILTKENKLLDLKITLPVKQDTVNTFRESLIQRLTDGINKSRKGTKYKPTTEKAIALRINKNPFFKGRTDHLLALVNHCESKGCYSKFFFVCPLK